MNDEILANPIDLLKPKENEKRQKTRNDVTAVTPKPPVATKQAEEIWNTAVVTGGENEETPTQDPKNVDSDQDQRIL